MSTAKLGTRAIVVGGSISGMLAARALADFFDEVLVLERDDLSSGEPFRKGVPQARQVHAILRAGLDSMNALFPGFEGELYEGGAVKCRGGRDIFQYDALGAWPRQDAGPEIPAQSRPLVEAGLRRRLAGVPNVRVQDGTGVHELVAEDGRVRGVSCRGKDGQSRRELGDLVVDASGRAAHVLAWLRQLGFDAPPETRIEVNIGYAGCFARPRRPFEGVGAMVAEPPPHGVYGGLFMAQEGDRIIVSLGSRGSDAPLADDFAGLIALAERLPHPIIYELIRDAEPLGKVARFAFPASVHRHFERMERWPEGLVCVGDTICNFNPIWGQGMSVAALEVRALQRLLQARAGDGGGLQALAPAFYLEAARIIETPWALSAVPDLAFETTIGERGPDFEMGRAFSKALGELAQQDASVRDLLGGIYHLTRPREDLQDPTLLQRVLARLTPPS